MTQVIFLLIMTTNCPVDGFLKFDLKNLQFLILLGISFHCLTTACFKNKAKPEVQF